ncbi:polyamine ABC transporter substrate-binding protein [Opitutus terrae]|uniref:Extracellular solute-binding protein family 1 n=1 Tax=Opitutus terrae (strain DSM 11246 / JCM 15787 / PB90-1) TaxID=452637 RepID=B1ZYK5_OPITP|nr:spermidine/putrescine ABC transporter substrate-binding protein [Opitutus terrae]ACB75241.1 extracellular solute-binding protein family 1 [Opitutus terrae PB90-1]
MMPPPDSSVSPSAGASLWTRRQWIGAAFAGLAAAGCSKLERFSFHRAVAVRGEIHVLIWADYLPQEVLDEFQARTGIRPVLHYFSSNDPLPDLLRARAEPYDLVMPSGFMAQYLRELGLIGAFDRKRLPNVANVDQRTFGSRFDPACDWFVPYIWGATGIGYNAYRIDGLPKSWSDLFILQTRVDGEVAGVSVLDDARYALGNVLIYHGLTPATATEADVERAGEVLYQLRDRIAFFESDRVAELLATGRVDLAMAWSGDVTRAMEGDPDGRFAPNLNIRISLPREGSILFKDGFCLPTAATNRAEAEEFVNYLLEPEVAAVVTNYSLFATTIPTARPMIDRRILNGPSYFLHPSGEKKNVTLEDARVSEEVYDRVWKQVKAGSSPVTPSITVPVAPTTLTPASS